MPADGCSGGLSWLAFIIRGRPLAFTHCCDEHDLFYEQGGWREKIFADKILFLCVRDNLRKRGRPVHPAYFVYTGVAVFGWVNWFWWRIAPYGKRW